METALSKEEHFKVEAYKTKAYAVCKAMGIDPEVSIKVLHPLNPDIKVRNLRWALIARDIIKTEAILKILGK